MRHNQALRQRTERIRSVLSMTSAASERRIQVFRDDPHAATLARRCLSLKSSDPHGEAAQQAEHIFMAYIDAHDLGHEIAQENSLKKDP